MSAVGILSICTAKPLQFNSTIASQIFGAGAKLPLFILPFFLVDAISNGEEIGWRGYLLPRLGKRHTPLESSIIVGLLWGIWHLPRYLEQGGGPFVLFMIRIVADSILYTWLFNRTGGSLLLTTIFHASGNTAGAFLPLSPGSNAILIFLTWITALVVLKYQAEKFIFLYQAGQEQVLPGRDLKVRARYQAGQR
jgi:membrane protease YdiL (CAAX protease family)